MARSILILATLALFSLAPHLRAGTLTGAIEDTDFALTSLDIRDAAGFASHPHGIGFEAQNGALSSIGSANHRWSPPEDQNGLIEALTVWRLDENGNEMDPRVTVFIDVAPVDDPPRITGTWNGMPLSPIPDSTMTPIPVFENLQLQEVDGDSLQVTVRFRADSRDLATLTIPFAIPSEVPALTDGGGPEAAGRTDILFTLPPATRSGAEGFLRGARLTVQPNARPVGIHAIPFSIEATDVTASRLSGSLVPPSGSSGPTLRIRSVNDDPTLRLFFDPTTVPERTTVQPFRLEITDPDPGEEFEVALEETTAPATIGTLSSPVVSVTGTAAEVASRIADVRFHSQPVAADTLATFSARVTQIHPRYPDPDSPDNLLREDPEDPEEVSGSLSVTLVNQPSSISGASSVIIRTTDSPSGPQLRPFENISISDPNPSQNLQLTLSLSDPSLGGFYRSIPDDEGQPTLEPLIGPLTGTANSITEELRAIVFRPTPGQIPVAEGRTVTLTIRVQDTGSNPIVRENDSTRVEIVGVDGFPEVFYGEGSAGAFPSADEPHQLDPTVDVMRPFEDIRFEDLGIIEVKVAIDDLRKGVLSSTDFEESDVEPGVFTFTGTAAEATAAIAAMTYEVSDSYLFPPGQPGRTDFTITVTDSASNIMELVFPIVLRANSRTFMVLSPLDGDVPGTLRHAVANAANNDVIAFALPRYPATIRLTGGPIVVDKHLSFRGPGADLLTISGDANANLQHDSGDSQIFVIRATATLSGLHLTRGFGATGGAISVERIDPDTRPGELIIEDCTISNSFASRYGGAIDAVEGSVYASRCLFERNLTSTSAGQAGGAVSLYTHQPCSFLNCTFSNNSQSAASGWGGGALYAENDQPASLFEVAVTHCTFSGNVDASGKGSSIVANVSGTRMRVRNSIFADFSSRNLGVAGAAQLISLGGNVSNDNTTTALTQNGVPQGTILLNQTSDRRGVDPRLSPLADVGARTRAHALLPDSPARGLATLPDPASSSLNALAVDQRGVVRNSTRDSGAIDADSFGKVVINEIQPNGPTEFIELYNPRDQASLSLNLFELRINGRGIHTFQPGDELPPGSGIVVADGLIVLPGLPNLPDGSPQPNQARLVEVPGLELGERGSIQIVAPGVFDSLDERRIVADVSYVASFVIPFSDPPITDTRYPESSITLAPQFGGSAYLPHHWVGPPPFEGVNPAQERATSSPGADTSPTPFGGLNAFPAALADSFEITEDEIASLDVLANDIDADGADELFIVDLNQSLPSSPPAENDASIVTLAGATAEVDPATAPLRGTRVKFDPRTAFQSLSQGARSIDGFAYSILDYGGGVIGGFSPSSSVTRVTAPAHRLADGEEIVISGAVPTAFNGTHAVTVLDDDSFTIPVAFASVSSGAQPGRWSATAPRGADRGQEEVVVSVLGRNDPPTPLADLVETDEHTVLRLFADPTFAGIGTPLDTDPLYPQPRSVSGVHLLGNDSDPDDDDTNATLRVIGVAQAKSISGYAGIAGQSPVTVHAPAHGLASGTTVLVSNYGGHPSYNGYHVITVTDADHFSIPVQFVDNAAPAGFWSLLSDDNRLQTISSLGAVVNLEIRANRTQTNIAYNPRLSAELDALALGENALDTFYYAVEDRHGAISLALITVDVDGVNDAPVPTDDPASLAELAPFLTGGATPAQVLAGSTIDYSLPSTGGSGLFDVTLAPAGSPDPLVLNALAGTDEDTPLSLVSSGLLANDGDVDRTNVLRIQLAGGQNLSRLGAAISLSGDGSTLIYDPTDSFNLQALAFRELVVDTFDITISDGLVGVVSTVAVLVEGRNDTPVASPASFGTDEKSLLTVLPPGLLLSGLDIDQDTNLPDNRKFLLPASDIPTTVFGARVDYTVERRDGAITALAAGGGTTIVTSAAHGLQTGEEVVLFDSGDLTGQYVISVLDADRFAVPVPYDASFTPGGTWSVLASIFSYDPTGSVFSDDGTGPSFTLQGLAEGQEYVDTFTYTLLDGSFLFANDDIFRVQADATSVELKVLENDTNLDGLAGDRRIVSVGTPSAGGTVGLNSDQSVLYSPAEGFVGDEHFIYTIEDALGIQASALVTVRVTVDRLNGNLRAGDDRFTVARGQSPVLQVLANDSLIPQTGLPLELVAIAQAPDAGGTALIQNGAIRYTPSIGASVFPYLETFTYTISGGGTARATATVEVLVVDRTETLNVRPDVFSISASASEATLNVLENDDILPSTGAALTVIAVGTPDHGTVSIVDGTSLAYTPDAGFLGADTFTYTAGDGFGGTGTAQITVNVGYLTTNNDFFSVRRDDASVTIDDGPTGLDVLANDRVLQNPGGVVSIISVTPASTALGTMTVGPMGGTLLFDPAEGAVGQQIFTYTVADATGRTATGQVTVTVIQSGVRASSDFYTVQTGSQEAILPVLGNDLRISPLPGTLAISTVGTGINAPDQGGTVTISTDFRTLVYSPAPGFEGTESFTYTVTDGDFSDTARVSIRSTRGETVAANDSFFLFRGSSDNRLGVLGNDRVIPDAGQILTITAIENNPSALGTLSIIEDGAALSYTPPENATFPLVETFIYEITSGGTVRAEAVVRVEVLDRIGARDLETNHDAFTVASDSGGTFFPVLANDSVLPASPLGWTITEVSPPVAASTPAFLAADFIDPAGLASILTARESVLTQDLWGRFDSASQSIFADAATSESDLASALALEFNALVDGAPLYDATRFDGITLDVRTQSLLDLGVSGERLRVLNRLLLEDAFGDDLRIATTGGVAQISGTGIIYAPQPGFVGVEVFDYAVSDGLGGTGMARVSVRVGDISVSSDRFTVLAGSTTPLPVTANDGILRIAFPTPQNPAQADFTLSTTRAPSVEPAIAGAATQDENGLQFTADPAFQGLAQLTYWVVDDSGSEFAGIAVIDVRQPGEDRDTATITLTVEGVNDAPKIVDNGPGALDDKSSYNPFANATVIEYDDQRNQVLELIVTYDVSRGTVTGAFVEQLPGVLVFTGTAAEITTALRGVVFTPFENRITVGDTEDTLFAVSINDRFVAEPVTSDETVATVTPINDPPTISGTTGGQRVYQFGFLNPFAGVSITDVDDLGLQTLTVTVSIDSATKGRLVNLGAFADLGDGTYTIAASPAQVTAALRALRFEPTPGGRITPTSSETATLTVTIDDRNAPALVDAVTTITILHAETDRVLPLTPVTGEDGSQTDADFGGAVAISGDLVAIGSPRRDTPTDAGSVFIYDRNSGLGAPWGQIARITGSNTIAGDRFGTAVALDGNVLVVGAPLADPSGLADAGIVYVFQRNTENPSVWTEVARLTAPVPAANEQFGTALALQDGTLVVGAPLANLPAANLAGRALIFKMGTSGPSNWTFSQAINASDIRGTADNADTELFGWSLGLDGNTLVVGSPGANRMSLAIPQLPDREFGAAYIFERPDTAGSFAQTRRLDEFTTSTSFSGFGHSVDIDGDMIAVGSHSIPAWAQTTGRLGSAAVFERNEGGPGQWGRTFRVSPPAPGSANFGRAVSIERDLLLVGAPAPDRDSTSSGGYTEVYRRITDPAPAWVHIDRLRPGTANDRFGHVIAMDQQVAVIGAVTDGINPSNLIRSGSARIHQFVYSQSPRTTFTVPNLTAAQGLPFEYTVPANAFDDPNFPAELTLSVSLSDGSPLPADGWLAFDPATLTFSGTPSASESRSYQLRLTATNPFGGTVSSNPFIIEVDDDNTPATLAEAYTVWSGNRFGSDVNNPALEGTVWGQTANSDGDAHDNVFEMIFGSDAEEPEPSPITFERLSETTSKLTFPLADGMSPAFVRVEWSSDLASWSIQGVTMAPVGATESGRRMEAMIVPPTGQRALFVRIATVP